MEEPEAKLYQARQVCFFNCAVIHYHRECCTNCKREKCIYIIDLYSFKKVVPKYKRVLNDLTPKYSFKSI